MIIRFFNFPAVITKGGCHANVVPALSELKIWLRAPDHADLTLLQQRCTPCIEGAAQVRH